ncbi:MAG: hydroxymethylbilane synthase [Candidatus Tectomicrobia bacterium]|uniref:Porphobilinogen deaminase n=1 Tax=Tectimicrobiota bacterium TaxID=2528274 RepID=A0A932FXP2_UNCTE|nr:hydroxymethylbilane synthase [Candidatus Tectomicrobia bacterium]
MKNKKNIRIGTRGSLLALWQTRWVAARLKELEPGLEVDVRVIQTTGDKILDAPLAKIGGKGLFVKEIEEALLSGQVDLAVHSVKDLPTDLPEGLLLGAVPVREDPWDAWIAREGVPLDQLRSGARIGTSSLRRQAQLLRRRPDWEIVSLRGNLDTRLRKLSSEGLDGIVLAWAGLERMGWADRVTEILPAEVCLPAIGQGALGIEVRQDAEEEMPFLDCLNHPPSYQAVAAERAFLRRLGGGCQVPIAALAEVQGDQLSLRGLVCSPRGDRWVSGKMGGKAGEAPALGQCLAERLLAEGAEAILEALL